jgi:hypothetical protein
MFTLSLEEIIYLLPRHNVPLNIIKLIFDLSTAVTVFFSEG